MEKFDREIAQKLLQIKAIELRPQNPFTWASGLKSPIYCDNRLNLSFPEVRNSIKSAFIALTNTFDNVDVIAGVATAGIPWGALVADAIGKPFIYVRSSAKAHGKKNAIEGKLDEGQNVLVIEDLISTGGSSIKACQDIEAAGGNIIAVLAIFNYNFQKATNNFKTANIKFETISHYHILLDEALSNGYITQDENDMLVKWNADPEAWSNEYS